MTAQDGMQCRLARALPPFHHVKDPKGLQRRRSSRFPDACAVRLLVPGIGDGRAVKSRPKTAAVLGAVRRGSMLAAAWLAVCMAPGAPAQGTESATPQNHSLTLVYREPASSELQSLFETLRDSHILESWTGYVNRTLKPLPHHIETAFAECGQANSSYDPKERRITFCYEEADRSFNVLSALGYESETQLLTAWIGSMLHQLYHELAHALVDMLSLPVLGREEDGADHFAVIVLLGHPSGWHLVLGAADYFREMAAVETELGLDPANRHPFFSQRYYNMLCLTYGSDAAQHEFLVKHGRLPESRAGSCRSEYLRAVHGWGTLLEPVEK